MFSTAKVQPGLSSGFRGEEWKAYFILIVRNACCSLLPNSYGTGINEVKVLSPSLKPELCTAAPGNCVCPFWPVPSSEVVLKIHKLEPSNFVQTGIYYLRVFFFLRDSVILISVPSEI